MIRSDRRSFLKFILPFPLLAAAPFLYKRAMPSGLKQILQQARVNNSMYKLGKAYRKERGELISFDQLVTELFEHIGPSELNRRDLDKYIPQMIKNDFATGNIVNVGGWRFSKIESYIGAMSTFL